MLLTKCPACDQKVSRKALDCPHCGQPIRRDTFEFTKLTEAILICLGLALLLIIPVTLRGDMATFVYVLGTVVLVIGVFGLVNRL